MQEPGKLLLLPMTCSLHLIKLLFCEEANKNAMFLSAFDKIIS